MKVYTSPALGGICDATILDGLMLKISKPVHAPSYATGPAEQESSASIGDALAILKRQKWTILTALLITTVLAITYSVMSTKQYTGTALFFVDARKVNLLQDQSILGEAVLDSPTMDSQLEVIKSERIALAVINKLDLKHDPEFTNPRPGLIGFLLSPITSFAGRLFGSSSSSTKGDANLLLERQVVEAFERNLTVKRQGLTYVVEIDYMSVSPTNAARIANAVADAYMQDQLDTKYDATRRANAWLQDRLSGLREQALNADHAVQQFKVDHNIVDTGRGLMNDQRLDELGSQSGQAAQAVTEAKARLDRITEIMGKGVSAGNITDTLKNDVITRLRSQYVDIAKQEADISARYGKGHLAAVNDRNQMQQIANSIVEEVKRIAETYRSDYQIALSRQDSVKKDMDELVAQSRSLSNSSVQLRQLESVAQSYRTLYDNFLQKFMETTQQESFPITDARVITVATPPLAPSRPRTMLIVPAGVMLGLLIGGVIAFMREHFDKVFRTPAQLEALLNTEVLGVVPKLTKAEMLRKLVGPANANYADRILDEDLGPYNHVVKQPFSRFAETLRNAKVAADTVRINAGPSSAETIKTIGIVSSLPHEGKSLISANLAHLIAHAGQRCVLIDGDLRSPSLTRFLTPKTSTGLVELVQGTKSLAETAWRENSTGLSFIPAVIRPGMSDTNEILSSDGMKSLLETLRGEVDYVVVDLPPIVPVVDVRACAHLFDAFIYVVEWGKTNTDIVLVTLASTPGVQEKLLGCVLNKTDLAAMQAFEGRPREFYEYKYYGQYGQA